MNSSVPDRQYSLTEVRAIFAMRKTYWSDGTKIQVFVLADNVALHQQFTKSKLHMFSHQLRRIWDRLIFSGVGPAPVELKSLVQMQEKISSIPGAIGYLITPDHDDSSIRILSYE